MEIRTDEKITQNINFREPKDDAEIRERMEDYIAQHLSDLPEDADEQLKTLYDFRIKEDAEALRYIKASSEPSKFKQDMWEKYRAGYDGAVSTLPSGKSRSF